MSKRRLDAATAELGTGEYSRQGVGLLRRARIGEAWRASGVPTEYQEQTLQRRARLQGLLLMLTSSVVSVLILYALWNVLRHAI